MSCACPGVPFELDEETQGLSWIHKQHTGVLSLDYVSTTLAHEASYRLELENPSDRALALSILERVYRSQVASRAGEDDMYQDGCDMLNVRFNGSALDLTQWRIGKQVGAVWVTTEGVQSTSARNHWRLPLLGASVQVVVQLCALGTQDL